MEKGGRKTRRGLNFTLRSAGLLITALCIGLGMLVERARRQKQGVEAFYAVHAEIQYAGDATVWQSNPTRSIDINLFHSVVWLNLDSPEVKDETLSDLNALPNLETLLVSEGSAISAEGLMNLNFVPGLKRLYLGSGVVDDRGLSSVPNLAELEELDVIDQPHVTDAGIRKLSALKRLRRLTLAGTGATKQGIADLQRALPNCVIDY